MLEPIALQNNNNFQSLELQTIENLNILKNQIIEIWKSIGWDDGSFRRLLKEGEVKKIKDFTSSVHTLNSSSNPNINSLVTLAITCTQRLESIENSTNQFKKALKDLQEEPWVVSKNIQEYAIQDQEMLVSVAKKIAQSYPSGEVSRYIHRFGIKDVLERFEIAKISAKSFPEETSKDIKNYELNPSQLYEIAKIAGWRSVEFINNYGLNKDQLYEIAIIAAHKGLRSKDLSYYGLDQNQIYEVAKIAAKCEGWFRNANDINDLNVDQKFEIAKIEAANNRFILKYCTCLGIEHLFEIAKIIAAKKSDSYFIYNEISEKISNWNFPEEMRIELAKISAKADGYCTIKNLNNYQISDKAILIDILKIAVKEDGEASKFIKSFDIEDPLIRFEIAKIAAKNKIEKISKNIREFNLSGQRQLIEVATIAAENGIDSSIHFKEYGIKEEKERFEVAKVAAKHPGSGIDCGIDNYDLNDEHKFEIAMILAGVERYGIARHISFFKITDPDKLFEIAKLTVKSNPSSLIGYIKENFNILRPEQRFEIAKMAALLEPKDTAEWFKHFEIRDESQRFVIAKLVIQDRDQLIYISSDIAYHFALSYDHRVELFAEACNKAPQHISKFLKHFELITSGAHRGLHIMYNPQQTIATDCSLGPLLHFDDTRLPDQALANIRIWLGFYLLNCQLLSTKDEFGLEQFLKETDSLSLMESIGKMRNPLKRFQLTAMYFQLKESKDGMQDMFINMQKSKSFSKKDAPIFRLLLTPFIHAYPIHSNWKNVFSTLDSSTYKDAQAQMTVINAFYSLIEAPELNMLQKSQLILEIFDIGASIKEKKKRSEIINRNLRFLDTIIQGGNTKDLMQFVSLRPRSRHFEKNSLQDILKKTFITIIGQVEIKDFGKKFEEKILNSRQPNAFITYASKLQKLNESKTINANLRTLLINVLDGSFNKQRYEIGEHLQKVFAWKDSLKEKWSAGNCKALSDFISEEEIKDKAEMSKNLEIWKFIFEKIDDFHINSNDFIYLQCLETFRKRAGNDFNKCMQEIPEIEKEIHFEMSKNEKDRLIEINNLNFQKALIEILNPQRTLMDKLTSLKAAMEYTKLIFSNNPNHQFLQDLKDLEKLLQSSSNSASTKGWTVEETDDWEDLLLCGTEVLGSCQNINGDPDYNKCLLNYILDGKNRLVVLRDQEGHLRARSILRLLWNNTTDSPVLYQERVYKTAGVSEESLNAIQKMCKHKANSLEISLYKAKSDNDDDEEDGGNETRSELVSLNGIAPYEYVDAGRKGVTTGSYVIPDQFVEIVK